MNEEKPWFIKGSNQPIPPEEIAKHSLPSPQTMEMFKSIEKRMEDNNNSLKEYFNEKFDRVFDELKEIRVEQKRIAEITHDTPLVNKTVFTIIGIIVVAFFGALISLVFKK